MFFLHLIKKLFFIDLGFTRQAMNGKTGNVLNDKKLTLPRYVMIFGSLLEMRMLPR